MASLSSKQMFAEERILERHVILTGQADTGKSFLLRDVVLTAGCNNILVYSVVVLSRLKYG